MALAAGALILLIPVLLIWPRWWLAALHVVVLALMFTGATVESMAFLKIVAIGVLGISLWRYGLPAGLDRMDRAWLVYIGVQLVGLASGAVQGRDASAIAESAWFFLQPPLYWFAVRYLLDVDAIEDNFLILTVAACGVAVWSVTSEGGAVVGAAVIGGYLSHVVLPFSAIGATDHRKYAVRVAFSVVTLLLVIDILAGGSRRFWIAAFAGFLPFLRKQKLSRQLLIVAGGVFAVGIVLLVSYQYLAESAAQGVGWRNIETLELIGEMEGIDFLTGLGYGYQFDVMMPWGVQSLGPGAHNYYAAILLNTGAVGIVSLFGVVATVFRELRKNKLTLLGRCYAFMFAGWLFAAIFARPTDGLWVLGFFPALAAKARYRAIVLETRDRKSRSADARA